MTEDCALERFGMPADASSLAEIRQLLKVESEKERSSQVQGDTELMKLLCVYLFLEGNVEDSILIWEAKTSSMDSDGSIDIHLLCGGGVNETLIFLKKSDGIDVFQSAVCRIEASRSAGDFAGFTVEESRSFWVEYYEDED